MDSDDSFACPAGFRSMVAEAAWTALLRHGVRCVYQAGRRIMLQGDEGRWVVILMAGRVKVLYAEPSGGDLLLAIRGPGDLLGELSRSDGRSRSATVEAMETCVAYTVGGGRFAEWVRRHRLDAELDRYVMAKMRETAVRMWQMAHCRPAARLADLLLRAVAAAGPYQPAARVVPMSQDQLAAALGVARSSITPVLADWKRHGVVRIERSRVIVTDLAALRHYADAG